MEIKGIVNDNNGAPLSSAHVFESNAIGKLTGAGTITRDNGEFSLFVREPFISFRYLGYKPLTIPAKSDYFIIELEPESFNLPPVTIKPAPKPMYFAWLFIAALALLLRKK